MTMRVLVTAGPTRQYVDTVRFLTTASSGRMGYAVTRAAVAAGCRVTLLTGPVSLSAPPNCEVVHFVSVADLKAELEQHFADCDALVMAAAVGDFRMDGGALATKLSRRAGPITLRLIPTEDVLAGVAAGKRDDQTIVAFTVEDGGDDRAVAKARDEMDAKNADFTVVNAPDAIAAEDSRACIISRTGAILPWARRAKQDLADEIVALLRPGQTQTEQ